MLFFYAHNSRDQDHQIYTCLVTYLVCFRRVLVITATVRYSFSFAIACKMYVRPLVLQDYALLLKFFYVLWKVYLRRTMRLMFPK